MPIAHWYDLDDDSWDQVILGGNILPGISTVTGPGLKRKVDVKRAKGSDKANLKDEGMDPAKITIETVITTSVEWSLWQALLPSITPKKEGDKREPLEIIHPATEFLGIKNIYPTDIPLPDLDKDTGIMTITISAIEWIPKPKPTPKGAGGTKQCNVSFDGAEYLGPPGAAPGTGAGQFGQGGAAGGAAGGDPAAAAAAAAGQAFGGAAVIGGAGCPPQKDDAPANGTEAPLGNQETQTPEEQGAIFTDPDDTFGAVTE